MGECEKWKCSEGKDERWIGGVTGKERSDGGETVAASKER